MEKKGELLGEVKIERRSKAIRQWDLDSIESCVRFEGRQLLLKFSNSLFVFSCP